jgi:arylsulfatase
LQGDDVTPRTKFNYYYNKNDLEAVRIGEWKLVFPHSYRSYENVMPGNNGYPGPYRTGSLDDLALYDLRRDPGERYNVIELYPKIVEELQAYAGEVKEDLGDNLTGKLGANRRPIGELKKK